MSQFIEMLGNKFATVPLKNFIQDSFPGEWGTEDENGNGIKVIRTTNFTNEGKLDLTNVVTRDIDQKKIAKKQLRKGDIILERSGGTNDNPVGRVVFFNKEGKYLFNNFTQLLRPTDDVNNIYLFYSLFNFYQMNKVRIRSMGAKTTGIQNLKMDAYMSIPIYNAPCELQNKFTAIYQQADKSEFGGFKSQFIEMFKEKDELSKIESFVGGSILSVKKKYTADDIICYIDISSIDASSNGIVSTTEYKVSDAPSRAQQCVQTGDILVSTVRPVNKNIAVIDRDETNLVASTGFCVLRPKEGYREYLLSIVKSDKYTNAMSDKANGGLYPAVNNGDVLSYAIPAPTAKELEVVSKIYKQADKSEYYN